jgi:hypothetical protein
MKCCPSPAQWSQAVNGVRRNPQYGFPIVRQMASLYKQVQQKVSHTCILKHHQPWHTGNEESGCDNEHLASAIFCCKCLKVNICLLHNKSSKMAHFVFKCNKEDYLSLSIAQTRTHIYVHSDITHIICYTIDRRHESKLKLQYLWGHRSKLHPLDT